MYSNLYFDSFVAPKKNPDQIRKAKDYVAKLSKTAKNNSLIPISKCKGKFHPL